MSFIDLLFPNVHCIVCGKEIFTDDIFCICNNCMESLPFIMGNTCEICNRKIKGIGKICETCQSTKYNFKLARSIFEYDGEIKKVIYKLKYENKKHIAESLSKLLYNEFCHREEFGNIDLIIPVPIHENRRKQRGYNQSELLCYEFLKTNKVRFKIAKKVIDTPSQTSKNFEDRKENVKGSFSIEKKDEVKNKNILIIDDIFTSGSTTNELARELLKAKAKSVKILTLCTAGNYKNDSEK